MAFQAGPYRWSAVGVGGTGETELGIVDGPPFVNVTPHAEEITGDNLGRTIQDVINQGFTMTLDIIFQEWKPTSYYVIFPQTVGGPGVVNLNNAFTSVNTGIGCLGSAGARTLMATRIANCPADGGAQWTFHRVIPHPDFAIRWPMGTRLRNIPMRFLVLPYEVSSGVYQYYSVE